MRRKGAFGLIGASLMIVALGALPQLAWSAAPRPAWGISQTSAPTNFAPGSEAEPVLFPSNSAGVLPRFSTVIRNMGGATTSEPIQITDTLPSGISPAAEAPPVFEVSTATEKVVETCAVSGQTINCEIPYPVAPFETIEFYVPLAITAPAGTVTNQVVVTGGGADLATNTIETEISAAAAPFAFLTDHGFALTASDEQGNAPLAGAHPFVTEFVINTPTKNSSLPSEGLRNIGIELPQGMVINPNSTAVKCTDEQLNSAVRFPNQPCPPASQIGEIAIELPGLGLVPEPLYDVVPQSGHAADFAFTLENVTVHIIGGVNGGFHLAAKSSDMLTRYHIAKIYVSFWGNPSDPRFDRSRFGAGCEHRGCSIPPSPKPLVTMPTSCSDSEQTLGEVDSWLGTTVRQLTPLADRTYEPIDISGCNQLAFAPTIESKATTSQGESPTGLEFSIHQPQDESLGGRSTAALRNATVSLPPGVTINPAGANGRTACTEEQVGYAPQEGKVRFQTTPQNCPNSSKLGTAEVSTPLLDHKLSGGIYLAKPFDNPVGSLVALYLAVEDEESGVIAKLAGKVEPDPQTGQLTATFTENPELPLEDVDLRFFNGSNAPLTTPLTCGAKTTTSTLTPWSTPEGVDAHPTGSFETTANCYASEGAAPKTVSFSAGTDSPLSGAYSPFSLRLSRADGTQHLTGIETTLPEGLLGKLAGVSYCPESGIAQARSREVVEDGRLEQQNPSCPATSEVGTVQVTAGSGITPIPVSGHAYLAGPYKGAPLSLVVVVPAVAGPFDLGDVVDRVALNVGEYDARIHAVADPLPTIRAGIPLDVRSIELKLTRPSFTLNPTSCDAMAIEGSVSTQAGQTTALRNSFQVGECSRLGFAPKLSLSLKGPTKRTGHPALKAVLKMPAGSANIASAQVSLPSSEFLDQGNIGKACTKPLLAARACPASSVYGRAKAWTPLLDQPLEGPVFLVGGYGYKLPALVAELNGQIRVLLVGKVDTGKSKGIRNTFEAVPDAPVERFVLELKGGKKYGLLENSENVCRKAQKADVLFGGQNGKTSQRSIVIANSCHKKHKNKSHAKKRHAKAARRP